MEKYVIIKFRFGKAAIVQKKYGTLTMEDAKRVCSAPESKGHNWYLGFTAKSNV